MRPRAPISRKLWTHDWPMVEGQTELQASTVKPFLCPHLVSRIMVLDLSRVARSIRRERVACAQYNRLKRATPWSHAAADVKAECYDTADVTLRAIGIAAVKKAKTRNQIS